MQHKTAYSASSLYMFRVSTTPIIRSTQNCNYSLRWPSWPRWRDVAVQKIWPVPEAVVTVLCTPDNGCGWQPKHVERTCRIINRLLFFSSRWTIINVVNVMFVSNKLLVTIINETCVVFELPVETVFTVYTLMTIMVN